MESKTTQSEVTGKQKKPYEPPKAEFVPLKMEERLLACKKAVNCRVDYPFDLQLS